MFNAFSVPFASLILAASVLCGGSLSFEPKTVLTFQSLSGDQQHQFVVRLARFRPDIFLEWESLAHQGTLHLFQNAVTESRSFTLTRLFEGGVDVESRTTMTLWISQQVFQLLQQEGQAEIKINNLPVKLKVTGRETVALKFNRKPCEIPALVFEDNRKGTWKVYDDPENPLVVAYQSVYFSQRLVSISADPDNKLRWVRKLPAVR